MEHRWSVRKEYEGSVAVNSPNRGTALCRMRNIGLGGMFIETGTLVLPANTPVDIGFTLLDDDELLIPFRLQAIVVRRVSTGVGVMFLETSAHNLNALRRALYPERRTDAAQPAWPAATEVPDGGRKARAGSGQ